MIGTRVLLAVVVTLTTCQALGQRVYELAKPRNLPAGAPKASDVIMRSLTLRASDDPAAPDTRRALSDFHVTRLEWTYVRDKDFIAQVRQSGRLFGGAASSALSHVVKTNGAENRVANDAHLACVDLDGIPVVPTWKRTWRPPGNWWMCANNPELQQAYVRYLKACIDAGAQIMQRDEPGGNANAVAWGGCFCEHCMSGFRNYLAENTTPQQRDPLGVHEITAFDYAEHLRGQDAPVGDAFGRWNGGELKERFIQFQTEATVAFHQRTRRELDTYAGRRVAFSCNNGCRHWSAVELAYDWCFGELAYRHANPRFLLAAMREAKQQGRCQVVTMPKKRDRQDLEAWQRLTRQTIAMAYACGGHCMAPWDVYMPGDAPRYFGEPEQYADLYGFVRGTQEYLDGYEFAGAFGPGIEPEGPVDSLPIRLPCDRQIYAMVRAMPGCADRAVVVHLVDWSDDPQPFDVMLDATCLFGQQPLQVTLLTPTTYDRAAHERADRTHVYGTLAETKPLSDGYAATVPIPKLDPWGLLVIRPAPDAAGVWQPSVWAEPESRFRESLVVRLTTATKNACVHYTTDGSSPTDASPVVDGPIRLQKTTTIQAIAVSPEGRRSDVATAQFRKRTDTPVATPPDDGALKADLKLWLRADAISLPDGAPVATWNAIVGPSAIASPHRTSQGISTTPPTLVARAMHGRPAIRFDGVGNSLAVADFANLHLAGKAFTVLMVTQSEADSFGICGNGIWGAGGVPRLYMQRNAYRYDQLSNVVELPSSGADPCISVFLHDGQQTMTAASGGDARASVSRSAVPVVPAFGSGGNLAMPFWSGNQNCAGDIAEIVIFDRQLSDRQRAGVAAYLADKYGIQGERRWE